MESTGEEHKEETSRIILGDENSETSHQDAADENISTTTTTTTDEETGGRGRGVMATPDGDSAGEEEGRVETPAVDEEGGIQQTSESQSAAEQSEESEQKPLTPSRARPGYYGDCEDDIIVFSSCYLPENSLENYQYVMDNLFRFVIGTLELMVAENYVIVYLCAGGQKEKLPGIGWLKECYTTIDRRLRKNLKGFYVVHPTWYIKIIATIIRPFISSKFSRKLQFVETLQELSLFIPTEHVQIPDCVRQYDQNQSRVLCSCMHKFTIVCVNRWEEVDGCYDYSRDREKHHDFSPQSRKP
ncbi:hypothetical protein CCH79_00014095 [Gambusia affinis]|uniref:CRAL-TRIO domain-containing protein n=1 Tax=Gambusia affinis TaxID=33528 RepID=A0A315WB46_GAMAF|nr:hypothetical protein CCH79_00014095 [Gambusia affinis]